jgi:hypothetical protein
MKDGRHRPTARPRRKRCSLTGPRPAPLFAPHRAARFLARLESSAGDAEALSLGGAAEADVQGVKCAPFRMTLCPEESSPELESIECSELMEAQHANCLSLDSGDVDDHMAGPDELVQAPLGDTPTVFFEGLLTDQPSECRHHLDRRECPQDHVRVLGNPALRDGG